MPRGTCWVCLVEGCVRGCARWWVECVYAARGREGGGGAPTSVNFFQAKYERGPKLGVDFR